jgi:hypothetical protein
MARWLPLLLFFIGFNVYLLSLPRLASVPDGGEFHDAHADALQALDGQNEKLKRAVDAAQAALAARAAAKAAAESISTPPAASVARSEQPVALAPPQPQPQPSRPPSVRAGATAISVAPPPVARVVSTSSDSRVRWDPSWQPAVTIMAHNRPNYLQKSLGALLRIVATSSSSSSSSSFSSSKNKVWSVYVSLDDPAAFPRMQDAITAARAGIIYDTGLNGRKGQDRQRPRVPQVGIFEAKAGRGDPLQKIAQHVKFAMDQTLLVKGHSHAVLLEEDLLPAPTFLHLFESTMWLLDEDPSLWCISAWNDNGPLPHGRDESLLFRTDYFPGLGWLMKRQDWKSLSGRWPRAASTGWDHWIRRSTNSRATADRDGARGCVVPEVPRTRHIADHGTNVNAAEQKRLSRMAFATSPSPALGAASMFGDVSYLLQPAYYAALVELISSSGDAERCSVVFYTRETYRSTANRFGLWPGEPRGGENGVIIARRAAEKTESSPHFPLASPDRVLIVDRRAAAALLEAAGKGEEAWRPKVGAVTVAANRGQSCDERCKGKGRCVERELEFANNCDALMAHFPCENGCGHQIGDEIPCYVSDPAAPTFRQCLVTEQRMPKCSARHPSTSRLCVCV